MVVRMFEFGGSAPPTFELSLQFRSSGPSAPPLSISVVHMFLHSRSLRSAQIDKERKEG